MSTIVTLLSLFFLTLALTGWYRHYAISKNILDKPNHRSLHNAPIPRGSGIIFIIVWLIFVTTVAFLKTWVQFSHFFLLVPGVLIVAVIGFWDDCHTLRPKWRFTGQIAAAAIVALVLKTMPLISIEGHQVNFGLFGMILTVACITWSTNLYNFMDGVDGLAGTEALFVYGIGGTLVWYSGGHGLAILAWGLSAVVAGFLVWNWPNAKVFMGDVGSTCLGFSVNGCMNQIYGT